MSAVSTCSTVSIECLNSQPPPSHRKLVPESEINYSHNHSRWMIEPDVNQHFVLFKLTLHFLQRRNVFVSSYTFNISFTIKEQIYI